MVTAADSWQGLVLPWQGLVHSLPHVQWEQRSGHAVTLKPVLQRASKEGEGPTGRLPQLRPHWPSPQRKTILQRNTGQPSILWPGVLGGSPVRWYRGRINDAKGLRWVSEGRVVGRGVGANGLQPRGR